MRPLEMVKDDGGELDDGSEAKERLVTFSNIRDLTCGILAACTYSTSWSVHLLERLRSLGYHRIPFQPPPPLFSIVFGSFLFLSFVGSARKTITNKLKSPESKP
ncbi:hypothetical protein K1719_014877 [Acacia pycnantha]|nr:hypothetical protein K1719_014877 [Acacia pycnantha]